MGTLIPLTAMLYFKLIRADSKVNVSYHVFYHIFGFTECGLFCFSKQGTHAFLLSVTIYYFRFPLINIRKTKVGMRKKFTNGSKGETTVGGRGNIVNCLPNEKLWLKKFWGWEVWRWRWKVFKSHDSELVLSLPMIELSGICYEQK